MESIIVEIIACFFFCSSWIAANITVDLSVELAILSFSKDAAFLSCYWNLGTVREK